MSILQTVLQVILLIFVVVMIFNIIIFVHELGHFLAGKWRGLQIDRFQIWFGKPIWKKEINGVQYGLGWIPAGGFVALPQMAPMESIEGGNTDRSPLPAITPLDKIIVAFAGPLFSLLLALLSAVVVWKVGKPADFIPSTVIGHVEKGSPAERYGLLPGDKIIAINDAPVAGFAGSLDGISEKIILSRGDKINFTVERPGEAEQMVITTGFDREKSRWFQRSGLRQVGLSPTGKLLIGKVHENGPASLAGLEKGDEIIGIDGNTLFSTAQLGSYLKENNYPSAVLEVRKKADTIVEIPITPVKPLKPEGNSPMLGILWDFSDEVDTNIIHPGPFRQVGDSLRMMWVTITSLVAKDSSITVDHLSGPVGIGELIYRLLLTEDGWRRIIAFMVLFNVNLAVLNMLPFPVLDGGHITLAILEKIFGRPVKARILEVVQTVCALALMSLMLYVTSKDIGDRFGRGGGSARGDLIFAPVE